MPNRAVDCARSESPHSAPKVTIPVVELERFMADYLLDCDYRFQSPATIRTRKVFFRNLIWFLQHRERPTCGTPELRQFFHYLTHGHEEPGGRFGNPALKQPVRPVTTKDYWVNFNCLFNWLVQEGTIGSSPMGSIAKPRVQTENVEPFTREQIMGLLRAARESRFPQRNEAVVLFLLDTGVRASEMCTLTMKNLDMASRHAFVIGKGNRHRTVYFSRPTGKALAQYLRRQQRDDDDPVFVAHGGHTPGAGLTVSGLRCIINDLATTAGIKGKKKSSHTFRHTCALMMLQNGCDVFSLKELLGHRSLTTSQAYLKLSQADVEAHHRRFSAVEGLRKRGSRA